ncbi:30S ribosomal protein S6 [candidate division BRC1 bacterium HGW-BRC1-1]|jgi:small subunit ribosomal protein S6|nr:MAG: 30S ribosomal protein S6 [candidate division BRC1 bacterium HGW-BRC1-1]
MVKYELVVIFDPFLEDAQHTEQVDAAKELVAKHGGEVLNVDVWGKRRMAYQIQKKQEGFYAIILFQGDLTGPALAEIERGLRLNEVCLREMLTRLPDEKPPRKVKVKKAKPAQPQGEGYRNDDRRSYDVRSAGDAGAATAGNTE